MERKEWEHEHKHKVTNFMGNIKKFAIFFSSASAVFMLKVERLMDNFNNGGL